jgi:glutamine---fructose-6-phosphate transaminase (isomerizing)
VCGIIGYVGNRRCQNVLFDGLKRLEYRGYDSAGVAWHDGTDRECVKAVGNLDALKAALEVHADLCPVTTATVNAGIGHTRWATHGGVTEANAHPHAGADGRVQIVLNGIIENHMELRDRLSADGIECRSETDAEVVAQLIEIYYEGDLADAVRRSLDDLDGHYAFVAMCADEPDTLVGVRLECPLVVGIGEGENFLASSISAFLSHTREVAVLQDGEIVVLRPDSVMVFDVQGLPHRPASTEIDWDEDRCEKDGYETFMLKEINEQGTAVAETLSRWRAQQHSLNTVLSDA